MRRSPFARAIDRLVIRTVGVCSVLAGLALLSNLGVIGGVSA